MERQGRSSLTSHTPRALIPSPSCSTGFDSCNHVKNPTSASIGTDQLDEISFLFKQTCPEYICQHEIHAKLTRAFSSSDHVHGAIDFRVLLWGLAGHGKRQIATHFANSLAVNLGKRILWVEGGSAVTFIRDLRLAYQLMTGRFHPSGVSVRWQLFRISRALSQCKSQWLMVVLDLHPDLQSSSLNETGVDLASYLPDGQILITYSPKTRASNDASLTVSDVPLEFSTRDIHQNEQIAEHDSDFIWLLINPLSSSSAGDAQPSSRLLKRSSRHLLSAVLGSSVARASNLTLDHFYRSIRHRTLSSGGKRLPSMSPASLLMSFGSTMEMLMDFLRDTNVTAEFVLMALAPACPRDVPVRLLRELRMFKDDTAEFEDAIELLQSISVLQVRTIPSGDRFVDLHHMTHSWLYAKFKGPRNYRDPDFRKLTSQWIQILDQDLPQDLPEIQHETDKQRYWLLLDLVLTVTKSAEILNLRCPSLVSLLRKIATFMSDFLVTPLEANRLLARALYLTATMSSEESGINIEVERLKLHCERSRLCALLGDYQQARQEVGYAQNCMVALEDSSIIDIIPYNLDDELIELLLRQGNHLQANEMIIDILDSGMELSAERRGRLHYWAVCCASNDRLSLLAALQHSHAAMSFWQSLPEDERWGSASFSMIAWVDAHADTLLQLERGRGALVFMPKLLDHYIEQCPPTTEAIWRVACCLVREYTAILELEAAEEIACRVLSLCEFGELEGASLAWALTMLHALGAVFARTGRYIESEGVFATCLSAIETRKPPRTSREGVFSSPNMWLELCHTLLAQGKFRQAEAARDLALQRGFDNLKPDTWKDIALEPRRSLFRVYKRILQAARDRNDGNYNAEDYLLDAIWPKTFSIPIKVLGDPFEHIKNGLDELDDITIPTSETVGEFSTILDLLGFRFDADASETASQDDHLWDMVFGESLTYSKAPQQRQMWEFWRSCRCRRSRNRTDSVCYNTVLRNQTLFRDDAQKRKSAKLKAEIQAQTSITKYFSWQKKYPTSLCPAGCPCIEANVRVGTSIAQIERERLYIYRSPNIAEREVKHAAYLYALKQYRYRFGPRPAIPYGMGFITHWRKPVGPTEANGSAKEQHEFFWAPDFVGLGDLEGNWGFLGQDENYLFTNPAMLVRSENGRESSLPDLPNIIITSYRLGEEVRGNIDLFDVTGRKQWVQTNIKDYLVGADDWEATDTEDANMVTTNSMDSSTPPRSRPKRRRGRKSQRAPRPVQSRRSSRTAHRTRRPLPQADSLKLYSIQSLGSVFNVADFSEQDSMEMRMKLPNHGPGGADQPPDAGAEAETSPRPLNIDVVVQGSPIQSQTVSNDTASGP